MRNNYQIKYKLPFHMNIYSLYKLNVNNDELIPQIFYQDKNDKDYFNLFLKIIIDINLYCYFLRFN